MADQPSRLTGYTDLQAADLAGFGGIEGYGNLIDAILEIVPELLWPHSVRTFQRMRREPQLAAILKVYTLSARRANWAVDPAGCRDEVVVFTADQMGLPILGDNDDNPKLRASGARRRNFTWAEHLRLAMLDQVFGHMFFEQAWAETRLPSGRTGWGLDQVQERMPHTVAELKLNPDGTLKALVQEASLFRSQTAAPPIRTANHALVYYVNEREGSNYFGQSLLRPSYGPWLIKDQVQRVHATSIRRFGLGIPEYEAPANATPQQLAEAQRTLANFKGSEHAGIVSPNGFKARLAGLVGNVPDAVAFINYLDRQMTRSTLTSLLDMATAERGARSLGETVMDLMVFAEQAVANDKAATGTKQLVIPLIDANFGEDEPAPQITVGDVGADVELTAQDISWLTQYAALTSDPALESWIRGRYKIPPVDPEWAAKQAEQDAAGGGE